MDKRRRASKPNCLYDVAVHCNLCSLWSIILVMLPDGVYRRLECAMSLPVSQAVPGKVFGAWMKTWGLFGISGARTQVG